MVQHKTQDRCPAAYLNPGPKCSRTTMMHWTAADFAFRPAARKQRNNATLLSRVNFFTASRRDVIHEFAAFDALIPLSVSAVCSQIFRSANRGPVIALFMTAGVCPRIFGLLPATAPARVPASRQQKPPRPEVRSVTSERGVRSAAPSPYGGVRSESFPSSPSLSDLVIPA